MRSDKWVLEMYRANAGGDLITTAEFETSMLRSAIAETHDKKFIVRLPAYATAADRITLLDLRAQGFDIAIRASRLTSLSVHRDHDQQVKAKRFADKPVETTRSSKRRLAPVRIADSSPSQVSTGRRLQSRQPRLSRFSSGP